MADRATDDNPERLLRVHRLAAEALKSLLLDASRLARAADLDELRTDDEEIAKRLRMSLNDLMARCGDVLARARPTHELIEKLRQASETGDVDAIMALAMIETRKTH